MFQYNYSVRDFFKLLSLFTANIAFSKTTTSQTPDRSGREPENVVDGRVSGHIYYSKPLMWPAWLMIDFGETMAIVKIFVVHNYLNEVMSRIGITIGM